MNAAINASKALWEKGDFTRIAHGRVSASWSYEATAPASDFREQYRAQARHGLFRLALRFNLMFQTYKPQWFPNKNRLGYGWVPIGLFKPVDSQKKPHQNKSIHQDTGFARTNLFFRTRWLAKADAALRQPSGIEPSHLEGFFMLIFS